MHINVECIIRGSTDQALLIAPFSADGIYLPDFPEIWVPKSCCVNGAEWLDSLVAKDEVELRINEWLAKEKGLT